ncbi:RabGAP/TBC [Phellopilus nigrolimitatus]|nr:RabGAP/TBC [Phellopilus nigrolimitatus]
MYGLESLSATHEGYVTAPESVESAGSHFTPSGRFRITNPGPAPSPSPPPISTRSSLQKSLPAKPSSTNPMIPSSISHAKRKSIVSSTPPTRPSTGTATSSATSSARDSGKPTEGEEPESYFVRNTYAQLDTTGVKGDGYEEGIERTRAKLGHDRQSVQLAAINDAKEEARGDVPTKELELLGSLDRYGFFVVPSHDRLVLLTSVSLAKPLQYFPQSINSGPPSPPALSSIPEPPPVSKARETRRIAKWERMLEAEERDRGGNVSLWRVRASKERKLRERVFKGIPDRWRAAAWEVLVGRWASAHRKESLDAQRLLNVLENLRSEYRSSLERPSSYDVQIDLDVPRTINGHVLFKTRYGQGQRSLFHTLHSFSLTCEDCGYCQGMGPLAATLLCYYEPEKVYATLVHFHDEYQLHDIFLPGFPGLLEAIYIQERILEKMMPGVYASFKKHMVSTTSYATKWYITLFANSVPFQTQLRLWDAFLLEGRDVFVITAIAIVWVLKDYLTSNQANFETILSLLSSFFVPENEDSLLKWIERALDDKKLREDMAHWRVEWHQLVADKKEGSALL